MPDHNRYELCSEDVSLRDRAIAEQAYRRGFRQGIEAVWIALGENARLDAHRMDRLGEVAQRFRHDRKPHVDYMMEVVAEYRRQGRP